MIGNPEFIRNNIKTINSLKKMRFQDSLNKKEKNSLFFLDSINNKFIFVLAILFLIVFHLSLRFHTLYLPHFTGDQRCYLATAMKLDKFGIKEYSLQEIGLMISKDLTLAVYYYSSKERDLLDFFEREAVYAYDVPFFHIPPLFSYLLMYSHRFFVGTDTYRVNMSLPKDGFSYKEFIKTQLYAAIIPLASDLLTMILVFFLGCIFFNRLVGVLAALFMCISPISIFTSQRILADTLLMLLVLITISTCYFSLTKNKYIFSIICGIFFGLSLLTKNTAVIAIIPIMTIPFITERDLKKGMRKIFTFRFLIIFATAILITFFWYRQMLLHYRTPFYNIYQSNATEASEWYKVGASRPWYVFIIDTPYQMPFYILGYFAIISTLCRLRKADNIEILSAVSFAGFLIILTGLVIKMEMASPENRYMLPAYPFLALLSAKQLNKVRDALINRFKIIDLLIIACIVIVSIWSIKMAMPLTLDYQVAKVAIPY